MHAQVVFIVLLVLVGVVRSDLQEKVIYGNDDRTEPYSISNTNIQTLIQADVAIMYSSQLTLSNNKYQLSSFGLYNGISCNGYKTFCSGEPYVGQIEGAFCSGFLVRNDNSSRIVTAGHCLSDGDCASMAFVFDFKMTSANTIDTNFPADNVYFCKSWYHELDSSTNKDFGVVELDRPVVGRTALTMRFTGTVSVGASLVMVGHPTGLPMKVDTGAVVKSVSTQQIAANTDSYAGNSGSMVVNQATWQVEGILVEGNQDFKYNASSNCCQSNRCSDSTGCSSTFEGLSKISQAYSWVYADLPNTVASPSPGSSSKSPSPNANASSSPGANQSSSSQLLASLGFALLLAFVIM